MLPDDQLYAHLASFISENKRALFDRIAPERTRHVTVVMEDIYQSHNASAVVRTCELLGVQDIHIIENRNKYTTNPDVTLGSSKWTDMHRYRDHPDNSLACVRQLKRAGYRIVATTPRTDNVTPQTISLDQPLAFCFGTELTGLSEVILQEADVHLRIPMYGFTESYNISVSAAISLYAVMERLRASTIPWRLNDVDLLALKLSWARKTVHSAKHLEERLQRDARSLGDTPH